MIRPILHTAKYWFLFIISVFQASFTTGTENYPAGARSLALSHASVTFSDTWSVFHNQATLAELSGPAAGFYFESGYGIDELSLAAGSGILPVGWGAFGMSLYQFGKGAFRENKYGLAFARKIAEKWSAGIQLDYFTHHLPENEDAFHTATFEAGILFFASQNFHLGAHVFNPVKAGFDFPFEKQKIPMTISAGGHYAFDKTVLVAFEAEKVEIYPLKIKSGIEFLPAKNLSLRMGISGKPVKYTWGFGYSTGLFSADVGFGYHVTLGITPSVSVQFGL